MNMYEYHAEESSLLQKCAQEIATAVASLIRFDVIITDTEGTVTGASGQLDVGDTLDSGRTAAASGDAVEVSGQDFSCISCPVQSMNGRVVGAVSVVGEPERARSFAGIVRRQVELMLRERELYAYAANRESTLENLVQDIASFVPGVSNEAMLLSRAAEYGFDRDREYTVLAIDLYQLGRFAIQTRERAQAGSESAQTHLLNVKKAVLASIRKIFSDDGDIVSTLGNNRFVVLHASAAGGEPETAFVKSKQALQALEGFELKAAVGVGSPAGSIAALAVSYHEAWKALFLGKKFCRRPGVYDIATYRLEDIVTTIDAPVRTRYIRSVTGAFRSDPDWEQVRETIRGWCESSFSLIETSKRLHIHRNTLIYRLDRIARLTGLNLRDFRTCLNLYLAIVMDQYTGPAMKE